MRGPILELAGVLLAVSAGSAHAGQSNTLTEVFFRFDSAALGSEAMAKLDAAARDAKEAPGAQIVIDGHCDPQGAPAYNVGLSIRRAERAKDHLIAKGVDPDRVVLVFYGEDGPRRATFSQDRRVTVAITYEPLYKIIDDALPVATAVTWRQPQTTAMVEGPRPARVARR